MINLNKSNVVFSSNVPEQVRNGIAVQMQVTVAENSMKYLKISFFWGKSKCPTIGFIKDKILQKLKGLKRNLLPQEGREVLIREWHMQF